MRVTQSMLSNTMLRNLNSSYTRLGELQEQISTGSKLLRPSDNPVGTTKAMSYRTQLEQNEQYRQNLDTATGWLDMTDDALGQITSAMTRVQELITQAANDTNQTSDRDKIMVEINQLHEEIKDIANTKMGENYIFSGTRINEPMYYPNTPVDTTVYSKATEKTPIETVEMYVQKDGATVVSSRNKDGELINKVQNHIEEFSEGNEKSTVYKTTIATKNNEPLSVQKEIKEETQLDAAGVSSTKTTTTTTLSGSGKASISVIIGEGMPSPTATTINNPITLTDENNTALVNISYDENGIQKIEDGNGNVLAPSSTLNLSNNRTLQVTNTGFIIKNTNDNQETYIDYTGEIKHTYEDNTEILVHQNGAIQLTNANGTITSADTTGKMTVNNPDNALAVDNSTVDKTVSQNLQGMDSTSGVEIYNEIFLDVIPTGAQNMFAKLETVFAKISAAFTQDANGELDADKLSSLLGGINSQADREHESVQGVIDLVLSQRSEVGAKQNRVDMMADRLALQKEALTKQLSKVEDVEYEEAITNMITQQSIHNASLSVGGKIIQQTLVDFIR